MIASIVPTSSSQSYLRRSMVGHSKEFEICDSKGFNNKQQEERL